MHQPRVVAQLRREFTCHVALPKAHSLGTLGIGCRLGELELAGAEARVDE